MVEEPTLADHFFLAVAGVASIISLMMYWLQNVVARCPDKWYIESCHQIFGKTLVFVDTGFLSARLELAKDSLLANLQPALILLINVIVLVVAAAIALMTVRAVIRHFAQVYEEKIAGTIFEPILLAILVVLTVIAHLYNNAKAVGIPSDSLYMVLAVAVWMFAIFLSISVIALQIVCYRGESSE